MSTEDKQNLEGQEGLGMGGVGEEALNSCVATRREGRPPRSVLCTLEKGQVQHPTLSYFKV